MKEILKEYLEAVEESVNASKAEDNAKLRRKKAYYKLLAVKEELRAMTNELLQDNLILN